MGESPHITDTSLRDVDGIWMYDPDTLPREYQRYPLFLVLVMVGLEKPLRKHGDGMFLCPGSVPQTTDTSGAVVDGFCFDLRRLSYENIKICIKSILWMYFLPKYGIVPQGDDYVFYDQ